MNHFDLLKTLKKLPKKKWGEFSIWWRVEINSLIYAERALSPGTAVYYAMTRWENEHDIRSDIYHVRCERVYPERFTPDQRKDIKSTIETGRMLPQGV